MDVGKSIDIKILILILSTGYMHSSFEHVIYNSCAYKTMIGLFYTEYVLD